jgi:hypothetical protein
MYTKGDENSVPTEERSPVSFSDVVNKYKSQAEGKTNFIVFVKEGLTSQELRRNVKNFDFIKP